VLDTVLGKLARQQDPNVLVGFEHADDAGVYRLTPEMALVQTVDFFTPIVDDPYIFGQIAATNALSDVYAMGGRPLTSLAMVCFPDKADIAILERILAGGLSKMVEAGCTVVGGHSIRDEETKFGYAVTGVVDPRRVLANGGARAGDRLLFTKALGTGVISTAIKKGVAKQSWIDAAVGSMTTLNKRAAEVIVGRGVVGRSSFVVRGALPNDEAYAADIGERPAAIDQRPTTEDGFATELRSAGQPGAAVPTWSVHALTDVTGFGLIGHGREMALASGVGMIFEAGKIPLLDGAVECVRAGLIPGGLKANREFAECLVGYASGVPEEIRTLLFDPQTAGGLLISVDASEARALALALGQAGVPVSEIGEVVAPGKPLISVR
jgi:selenide,water dikinase